MERFSINKLDAFFGSVCFECFCNELRTVVQIDCFWLSSMTQGPLQAVDCFCSSLVQVCFATNSVTRAVISKSSDVDFSYVVNPELKSITLLHRINMFSLKAFARLWLCFDMDEQTVIFENVLHCSPVQWNVELMCQAS